MDGIIVPGGFGESGIEGKLNVIRYARENRIPYFGLCYGMQLLTIEYARNIVGLKGASSAEIDPKSPHRIIDVMVDQKKKIEEGRFGGTMRLGSYPAKLKKGTVAFLAYEYAQREIESKNKRSKGKKLSTSGKVMTASGIIYERHRHRYEVNPKYIDRLERSGLVFSGTSPDGTLMEIAELTKEAHPFFLGTQFHPEFLARPLSPHPLFTEFMRAAKERQKNKPKEAVIENASNLVETLK